MLGTTAKVVHTAQLSTVHQTVNTLLSGVGKSVATIAAAAGISQDDAEHRLSMLIDEALASKTVGNRATSLYTAQ